MTHRQPRYTARKIEDVATSPGCWNRQRIGVYDGNTQIGEYLYGYSSGLPFYAFRQGEDWFALVSLDYTATSTATSIMSLPDCQIIGGEKKSSGGFCPVEFYVPAYYWYAPPTGEPGARLPNGEYSPSHYTFKMYDDRTYSAEDPTETPDAHWLYEPIGFRSGCIWGDDSSWKLQTIDLTHAREGKIAVLEPNYVELADYPLRNCIELQEDDGAVSAVRLQSLKYLEIGRSAPDPESQG